MRSPEIPPGAEIVTTFAAYKQVVEAYFRKAFNLLVIVGRPGLSKSKEFQLRLKEGESYRIKGHATPYHTYKELWWHKDELVVIDDGELLWREKDGRILLRSLTEAETYKDVFWASANKDLAKLGIPTDFRTRSKVAVICNKFVFGKADEYEAILDRAQMVYFDPTPLEVHVNTATWFWDQEIYDYLGSRLNVIDSLTARTYHRALEQKKAGMDWRRLIDDVYCHDAAKALVQKLETSGKPKMERIEQFKTKTGLSQATYYNYVARLKDKGQLGVNAPPKLKVMGTEPDDGAMDEEAPAIPLETGNARPNAAKRKTGRGGGEATAENLGATRQPQALQRMSNEQFEELFEKV